VAYAGIPDGGRSRENPLYELLRGGVEIGVLRHDRRLSRVIPSGRSCSCWDPSHGSAGGGSMIGRVRAARSITPIMPCQGIGDVIHLTAICPLLALTGRPPHEMISSSPPTRGGTAHKE